MNNSNEPMCPLCTNVLRMHDYLLAPDEIAIFDSLVIKAISFRYKPFFYSQKRMEKETRVKRTRYEAIIKKFENWEIIQTYVDRMPNTEGQIRYFYVDFHKLSQPEILAHIVNETSTLFLLTQEYMAHHHRAGIDMYLRPEKKKEQRDKEKEERVVEEIRIMLQNTMNQRRRMYNNGELAEDHPTRKYEETTVALTAPQKKALLQLHMRYGNKAIEQAFTAYYDDVLDRVCKPKNIFNYFLTKDKVWNEYSVFTNYLGGFTLHYAGSAR